MIPKNFNINVTKEGDTYIINANSGTINVTTAHSKVAEGLTRVLMYLETEYTAKIKVESLEVNFDA